MYLSDLRSIISLHAREVGSPEKPTPTDTDKTYKKTLARKWTSNIKFILPHCSKDVYKHSFMPVALWGWNALPQSVVEAEILNLFFKSCFLLSAHFPSILFSWASRLNCQY